MHPWCLKCFTLVPAWGGWGMKGLSDAKAQVCGPFQVVLSQHITFPLLLKQGWWKSLPLWILPTILLLVHELKSWRESAYQHDDKGRLSKVLRNTWHISRDFGSCWYSFANCMEKNNLLFLPSIIWFLILNRFILPTFLVLSAVLLRRIL